MSCAAIQKRLGGKPGDSLFELVKDRRVAEDVVKVMRDEILGFSTFLVRDVERPIVWQGRDIAGAVMLRGNARKDARTVANALQDGLDSRCAPYPCRLLCSPKALRCVPACCGPVLVGMPLGRPVPICIPVSARIPVALHVPTAPSTVCSVGRGPGRAACAHACVTGVR